MGKEHAELKGSGVEDCLLGLFTILEQKVTSVFFAIPASRVSSLHLRLVASENIAHRELYESTFSYIA